SIFLLSMESAWAAVITPAPTTVATNFLRVCFSMRQYSAHAVFDKMIRGEGLNREGKRGARYQPAAVHRVGVTGASGAGARHPPRHQTHSLLRHQRVRLCATWLTLLLWEMK